MRCPSNDDGTYDIGVHIAVISYFVKPTLLSTTMPRRAQPVSTLSNKLSLCSHPHSANSGKDCLAFPVIFTMIEEGKATNGWFGHTVVKQSAQLSFANAQDAIDGKVLGGIPVHPGHDASAIEHDVKILHRIAKVLRDHRAKSGALFTETPKSAFTLDESGRPVDCDQSVPNDTDSLVQ